MKNLMQNLFFKTFLFTVLSFFFLFGCNEKENEEKTHSFTQGDDQDFSLKIQKALQSLPEKETITGQYLSSRFARRNGDWQKASSQFNKLVKQRDIDLHIWRKHLFLSLLTQDQKNATQAANFLFENDPDYDLAHLTVFSKALSEGKTKKARAIFEKIKSKENNASRHYILFQHYLLPILEAWLYVAEKNPVDAIKSIDILTKESDFTPVYAIQKAFILDFIDQKEKAEKYYALAFATAPVSRITQAVGNFYERAGMHQKAQSVYQKYSKLKPKNWVSYDYQIRRAQNITPSPLIKSFKDAIAEAVHDVGGAFYAQSQYDIALYYNAIALLIDNDHEPAHYMVANIYGLKGYDDEAKTHYQKMNRDGFYAQKALFKLAEIDYKNEDYQQAIIKLETLKEKQENKLDILLLLARCYHKTNENKKALALYDTATALSSIHQRWLFYFERGQLQQNINNWQQAEDNFLKALELNADNPILLNHIGYSWVERQENLDQARIFIERALEFDPGNPYYLDSLGQYYYLEKNYHESITHLQSALSQLPNDSSINDHLGNAYWQIGQKDQAKLQWERSLNFTENEDEKGRLHDKLKNGLTSRLSTKD